MRNFSFKLIFIAALLLLTSASTMASHAKEDVASDVLHKVDERSHWPHLVGKSVSEVLKTIKEERPELHVVEVPQNSMVTMDMRFDRVRIFSDVYGNVVKPPRVG
jgi:Potato inhibitor I family